MIVTTLLIELHNKIIILLTIYYIIQIFSKKKQIDLPV
jgi:hypothetical protein